jgi:hypothetical protein
VPAFFELKVQTYPEGSSWLHESLFGDEVDGSMRSRDTRDLARSNKQAQKRNEQEYAYGVKIVIPLQPAAPARSSRHDATLDAST